MFMYQLLDKPGAIKSLILLSYENDENQMSATGEGKLRAASRTIV